MVGRRIRDLMRQGREDLHREMSVPALYIPAPNATPLACSVRVWLKTDNHMVGKLPGLQGAAETSESEDRLRFNLAEIPKLFRNAVVSVEPGEAYRIDHLYEADLNFQTARVLRLPATEAAGLPLP
ncbi:hypothetical protein [Sphingomonas sp. TREG-RG-20F-R18-01]|uniref:hypothetical protein n=1 Tax=Sphingomonas sp. TREG-RG-20F-R18-01 TaxID=2914982 RepID=UPI001F59CAAD|nr:hypothetical protein [Sphingomonas sp. TREG-RG-20F-R18-01]